MMMRTLNKTMIRNLTAMTASQLKKDLRDERKKSMLSRLSPEAGKLFKLLAARDWKDKNPKMSASMKDLVSDKDAQWALAIINTQTKRRSGLVSEKGLFGFFANEREPQRFHHIYVQANHSNSY
jgi:hypothetical protein